MSNFLGLALIGLLILLAMAEVVRYARSARSTGALPYPRRRLSRRLAIAMLFCGAIGLVLWWPGGAPLAQLGFLLAILVILAVGLSLLWRDLRETSQAVLRQTAALNEEARNAFMQVLRESGAPGPVGRTVEGERRPDPETPD